VPEYLPPDTFVIRAFCAANRNTFWSEALALIGILLKRRSMAKNIVVMNKLAKITSKVFGEPAAFPSIRLQARTSLPSGEVLTLRWSCQASGPSLKQEGSLAGTPPKSLPAGVVRHRRARHWRS
jgi:hypothetical protein